MSAPYRLRFHPRVADDLRIIAGLLRDYAGSAVARRILAEIEADVLRLAETPHKGSVRDDIAPGLRAIPAGRRAVVAFTVDDRAREVRVLTVTYGGADWVARVRRRP